MSEDLTTSLPRNSASAARYVHSGNRNPSKTHQAPSADLQPPASTTSSSASTSSAKAPRPPRSLPRRHPRRRQGGLPPLPELNLSPNHRDPGCAAHAEGRAILYADKMTDSMQRAIFQESNRRREKLGNSTTTKTASRPCPSSAYSRWSPSPASSKPTTHDLTDEARRHPLTSPLQQELRAPTSPTWNPTCAKPPRNPNSKKP